MENIIIIGIIAVVVAVAILHTVKHFRGKGGCCGGQQLQAQKKEAPIHPVPEEIQGGRDALRPLQEPRGRSR